MFEMMGELVIKIHVSPQVWQSTAMKHIFAMVDMQTSFVALGPWFALVVITQGQGFGVRHRKKDFPTMK